MKIGTTSWLTKGISKRQSAKEKQQALKSFIKHCRKSSNKQLTYGVIKEFKNGTTLWYEPITDELDGFALRGADDQIIQTWVSASSDSIT